MVTTSDHDLGVSITTVESLTDEGEVCQDGIGCLVAVARIFLQQSLQDFLQHSGRRHAVLAKFWHGSGHVQEKNVAHVITVERCVTSEGQEQDDAQPSTNWRAERRPGQWCPPVPGTRSGLDSSAS